MGPVYVPYGSLCWYTGRVITNVKNIFGQIHCFVLFILSSDRQHAMRFHYKVIIAPVKFAVFALGANPARLTISFSLLSLLVVPHRN